MNDLDDQNIVILITLVVAGTFLTLGLYTTFIHSEQVYEGTEILRSGSKIVLESDLQRGDQVKINLNTLERNEVKLNVIGRGTNYQINGSSFEITVPIPSSSEYRFEILNSEESYVFVNYLYEINLTHAYWTGIASIGFFASLLIAVLFRFRKMIVDKACSPYQ